MNPKEKTANKEAFRRMSPAEKFEYIRTYYWGPILLAVITLVILVTSLHRHFTKKEEILYTAFINVNIGEELGKTLHQDYLISRGMDPKRTEVVIYPNLYLSDDPSAQSHEMAYASKMKLLATINSKKLDLVLMNREAYDIISGSEYLLDLTELSEENGSFCHSLEPFLTENTVIIKDNAIEVNLNEADTYQAVTKNVRNGISLSGIAMFKDAGFSDEVYMGIIANTPRLAECLEYLKYLLSSEAAGA